LHKEKEKRITDRESVNEPSFRSATIFLVVKDAPYH